MSEETNPVNPANPTTPVANPTTSVAEVEKPKLQIIDKGTYVLEQVKFRPGTDMAGLEYFVKQYKTETEEQSKASLDHIIALWKPSLIVGLVNTAMRSAQRVKAQSEINGFEAGTPRKNEYNRRLLQDPCLLSAENAENWTPGERELSLQGMMRQVAQLVKEGKPIEANELLKKVNEKMAEQLAAAEDVPETEA